MTFKFSNRASSTLASSITAASNTILLTTGGGALFPFLNPDEVCQAAIVSTTGATEYVTITAIVGNTLTVQRAKEGSAAQSFAAGSRVECRVTAEVLSSFLPRTGGVIEGDLDFNGVYKLKNLKGFDPPAVVLNAVHTSFVRAEDIDPTSGYNPATENSIVFPAGNGDISTRGRRILHTGFFDSIIFIAYININNVPPHFKLCDGTNGTPDLRGKFLRGWDIARPPVPAFLPGDSGGADSNFTTPSGRHGHTGRTQDTILDASNLPSLIVDAPVAGSAFDAAAQGRVRFVTVTYGSGRAHYHFIGEEPDHQHAVNTVPSFMTVAYVMFAAP